MRGAVIDNNAWVSAFLPTGGTSANAKHFPAAAGFWCRHRRGKLQRSCRNRRGEVAVLPLGDALATVDLGNSHGSKPIAIGAGFLQLR